MHLATKGGTVAILAQGTSWAVATTQAFWAAVQIQLAGFRRSKSPRTLPPRLRNSSRAAPKQRERAPVHSRTEGSENEFSQNRVLGVLTIPKIRFGIFNA